MTRLQFRYYMKLSFSEPVKNHRFSLKCIPKTDENQRVFVTEKNIFPNRFISEGKDSFGNVILYGYEECEHDHFLFEIRGAAETGLNRTSEKQYALQDSKVSLFKYQTNITRPGESILKYLKRLEKQGIRDDVFATHITHTLVNDFAYMPGTTDIHTTAEEAMNRETGVCQDYAHIMISLCRLRGIPCRYVTGMMQGEGASHAWTEVFVDQKWIGMDPTNAKLVDEHYIKIAHGRDYKDCLVNQGVFTGNAIQTQEVNVSVEVLEESGV